MDTRRLKKSRLAISIYFENQPQKIYRYAELTTLIAQNRDQWKIPSDFNSKEIVKFLIKSNYLIQHIFSFPQRKEIVYSFGETSIYEIAPRLKANSYLSHYSAMFTHEITEQVPKTIYINQEQPRKKNRDSNLQQQNIDKAFQSKVRVSNNIAIYKGQKICVLNGMNTGNLGIIDVIGPLNQPMPVTNVERTLIDIAVRPVYAGGISRGSKSLSVSCT